MFENFFKKSIDDDTLEDLAINAFVIACGDSGNFESIDVAAVRWAFDRQLEEKNAKLTADQARRVHGNFELTCSPILARNFLPAIKAMVDRAQEFRDSGFTKTNLLEHYKISREGLVHELVKHGISFKPAPTYDQMLSRVRGWGG